MEMAKMMLLNLQCSLYINIYDEICDKTVYRRQIVMSELNKQPKGQDSLETKVSTDDPQVLVSYHQPISVVDTLVTRYPRPSQSHNV